MVMRVFTLCGGVVMPAAIDVVMRVFTLCCGVVMPAAIGVVMRVFSLSSSLLQSHFMQLFAIQLYSGMVSSGGIHMVIATAIFSQVCSVVMPFLSQRKHGKPQKTQSR